MGAVAPAEYRQLKRRRQTAYGLDGPTRNNVAQKWKRLGLPHLGPN